MYDSIRRVVAAVCVAATVIQPALASAQSFSLEPSGPRSAALARPMMFVFPSPGETTPTTRDGSSPGLGDWKTSMRLSPASVGTVQPRPQLRGPRTPPRTQHSKAYRGAQRVTAAFALGLVGFYVGALTAYSMAIGCNCGSIDTVYIGGGMGAAGGAAAALWLTR
jgi:hypothetical protein